MVEPEQQRRGYEPANQQLFAHFSAINRSGVEWFLSEASGPVPFRKGG